MKKSIALAFMLFSLVAVAETSIKFNGSLELGLDQFKEADGKQWYSMNGDVFGTGDWKQSTNDNWNDNREKAQAILNLNSEIKVSDKVKINIGFESMVDELIGKANGSGETAVQEFSTVRDNQPVILKDITAEIDTDLAKFTITNNFNYNFNNRVLATQFEDNSGEPLPYGEGILAEKDVKGIKTKAFLYQATEYAVTPNTGVLLVNGQNDIIQAENADKMVYGIDMKKDFSRGKIGVLAINEHDKSSEESGDNFNKKLDTLRVALNGELELTGKLSLKGEYITAQYGSDVTAELNTFGQVSYDEPTYDLSAVDAKKDTNLMDLSATYNATDNLQIVMGYKNVGEDYTAVLGNSQRMDSWLGDASFNYIGGKGYENGMNAKVEYTLPTNLLVKTSFEYKNYDQTRTALNSDEDTNNNEMIGKVQITQDKWKTEASYRKTASTNSGSGSSVSETDLVYDDMNANGEISIFDNGKVKAKVNADLNYYIGTDNTLKQNFSNEMRVKAGTTVSYKMSDKTSVTGAYSFGYATENNDVINDGSAIQNLFKLGIKYDVSSDVAVNLMYKYDNYAYDVVATANELTNSVHKKEAEHQWYDGLESWDHSGVNWDAWRQDLASSYKGYATHEIKASVIVRF